MTFRERVQIQFMDPANVSYLNGQLAGTRSRDRMLDLMLLFMKTHGNAYDLSLLDASRGMSEEKKFWLAVQNLNRMFLEVVREHTEADSKEEAIGRYGYAESMFIATEMRPPCYENLNDSFFPGYARGSSSCERNPSERPFDRYRSAVLNHASIHAPIDRETIYGAETRIGDEGVLDGVSLSMMRARDASVASRGNASFRVVPNGNDRDLYRQVMQASVNDQVYPEPFMDMEAAVSSCGDSHGGEESFYIFSSSHADETEPLYPEKNSEEGNRQAHIARYGKDRYGGDTPFPWYQNLSKRHIHRKSHGDDDDMLDASIIERDMRSTRGGLSARGNPHLQAGEGEGYRYKGIYAPPPGGFGASPGGEAFAEDTRSTWNREMGHKLYPYPSSSLLSYPRTAAR